MLFCLNKFKAIMLKATFKCRHNFIFNYFNSTVKTFKMLQNIYVLNKCSLNVELNLSKNPEEKNIYM